MKKHTLFNHSTKGISLVEAALGILAIIVVALIATSGWTEVSYRIDKYSLGKQVSEISSGADSWKMMRSNFSGVSMSVLCADGQESVSESTCGPSGDGTASNAFGGDFNLSADSNPSRKVLELTGLPTERINELADGLAPMTANNCQQASSCATINASGSTITLTL